MNNNYEHYIGENITKELLDSIKLGDLIKINDWKKPYKVKGVIDNYFVMSQKMFGKTYYSVCEKKRWNGTIYNNWRGGMFHCGADYWSFGVPIEEFEYDFDDYNMTIKYLKTFEETDKSKIRSELTRRSIPIRELFIKRCK